MLLAGRTDRVLERRHIAIPVRPFRVVGFGNFPVALRILQTGGKTFQLLLGADIEEKLHNMRAVIGKQAFEFPDALKTLRANSFRNCSVYPWRENIFVMRSIEYRDVASRRRVWMDAPQEVMRRLFRRRDLESGY